MAFTAININDIDVGDPVTAELMGKVKDNFDDHETRINSLESVGLKVIVFDFPILNATSANTLTGLTYWRSPLNFILTDAKIAIYEVGALTGVVEVDIKKGTSLDPVSYASVFTTRPSIDFSSASDYDESLNAVYDPGAVAVNTGEYLRIDITSLPSNGVVGKFYLSIIGEV